MITLKDTLTDRNLHIVWRQLRGREREVHLTSAPLVRDSTGGMAFDLTLKEAIMYLRARILEGSYSPHPPLIVEAAKSKLLHRTLFFLMPDDAIVLHSLVLAIHPSLQTTMPPWVSSGREDQNAEKSENRKRSLVTSDYEGWWSKWLRIRKLQQTIEGDDNPLIVTSDIVNFFGSIDLVTLRSQMDAVSNLDSEAKDLLFFCLERLRPVRSFRPTGLRGLPTVEEDTSRILASFYLGNLDEEFLAEGEQSRYVRWVDDIVISVADETEGTKVIGRIERALGGIGLVANSSKTDIVTKSQFRQSHHEDENQYLDEIHQQTEQGALSTHEMERFEERLAEFLGAKRHGRWDRILRRYYTESRRARSKLLLDSWHIHLKDLPTNGKNILDYVTFNPGDSDTCRRIFDFLKRYGAIHEDVCILLYEALLMIAFPDDPGLCDCIVSETHSHYRGACGYERPRSYVQGLQALTIYKYGHDEALTDLARDFPEQAVQNPDFATYAFLVLCASKDYHDIAIKGVEHIEDPRILRLRSLVSRLEESDGRAINALKNLIKPKMTKYPIRAIINPRALPLLAISLSSTSAHGSNLLPMVVDAARAASDRTEERELLDGVTQGHLERLTSALKSGFLTTRNPGVPGTSRDLAQV